MATEPNVGEAPLHSLVEVQEDTRQRICGGRVLLRIRLAPDEVASLSEPDPLFSLVPRTAYLPFLFHDVLEHFKKSAIARMGQPYELWFDFNHTALKWHFPVGVLCDALVGVEVPVPLDLTVHFRGNSVMSDLLPFSGMADLQRSVMNAFKQAIFLEVGSASRFMRLEKKEHMMLWDAILQSDIKSFSQVEEKLMCSTLAECKSLAVRLHIWAPAHDDEVLLHKAPALRESGAAFTLSDFLALAMPPLLSAAGDVLAEGVEVLTQGLIVPLDTPLFWLALHASYLDHFVHLIARVPDSFLKPQESS